MHTGQPRVEFDMEEGVPASLVFGPSGMHPPPTPIPAAKIVHVPHTTAPSAIESVYHKELEGNRSRFVSSMNSHAASLAVARDSFASATRNLSRGRLKPVTAPGAHPPLYNIPDQMEAHLRSGLAVLEDTVKIVEDPSLAIRQDGNPMHSLLVEAMRLTTSTAAVSHIAGAVVHENAGGNVRALATLRRRFDDIGRRSSWDTMGASNATDSDAHHESAPDAPGKHTGDSGPSKPKKQKTSKSTKKPPTVTPPEKDPVRERDLHDFVDAFINKHTSTALDHGSIRRAKILHK